MKSIETIIAIQYHPGDSSAEAELLAASLMHLEDQLNDVLFWVYELPADEPVERRITLPSFFSFFRPSIPQELMNFPFAAKVFAAAEAEACAEKVNVRQIILLDPDTLILHEPAELNLLPQEKIAVTPVHLRNISSVASEPMDEFWKLIYTRCHVPENQIFSVTSMIDQIEIRAHFNAGLISVNPRAGILRRWKENFLALFRDPLLESLYLKDKRYKIYVHQAVLSATILELCDRTEMKLLPTTYNFPLHLVNTLEIHNRPTSLDHLTTARYDDFNGPGWSTALPSSEPLYFWLAEAINKIIKR